MLGLVNYGSSDEENEISDDEQPVKVGSLKDNELEDDLIPKTVTLKLPEPSRKKINIVEEDDEFLHKKAAASVPLKKGKVRIVIPRLSDFKDDDDDEKLGKVQPVNKKTSLLSMLPRPSNSFAPAPRPTQSASAPPAKPTETTLGQPKKVGLIPYALMSHKPKASDTNKSSKKKDSDDEDDDDEQTGGTPEVSGSYFTFASKDDELPAVSEDEVRALVAKESARLEERKRQHDETETADHLQSRQFQSVQQQQQNIDEEAMKALMGGNRAKRSKVDNIQIIDLSAAEVMPNRDEWLRKTLAGETSYVPTGNISEKGPSALAKRKNQVSFLSMRAETNVAELEAMWASNRQSKRETKSKYGF